MKPLMTFLTSVCSRDVVPCDKNGKACIVAPRPAGAGSIPGITKIHMENLMSQGFDDSNTAQLTVNSARAQ